MGWYRAGLGEKEEAGVGEGDEGDARGTGADSPLLSELVIADDLGAAADNRFVLRVRIPLRAHVSVTWLTRRVWAPIQVGIRIKFELGIGF